MSGSITVNGSSTGTAFADILLSDDIQPGTEGSYQMCKLISLYHPLGPKLTGTPIKMAQVKPREIVVGGSPDDRVAQAFKDEWDAVGADNHIFNTAKTARTYGIGSLIYGVKKKDGTIVPPSEPIDPKDLSELELYFNVLDPLNTAGSLVLNQDPNSPDFQKHGDIAVNGVQYHRSRACVLMNGDPVYIAYTSSGFGYVGRSCFQAILFPLKSFIQTMITDDMISKKAGVLIAKLRPAGSITDRLMASVAGLKRNIVKESATNNVISVAVDESIESLNMMNIDGAGKFARDNILKNIALGADMPAKIINSESFVEGFGEGTEDAKDVAHFIDGVRIELKPIYDFMDAIVMRRAWNPEFFETIQADFPEEYGDMKYDVAFYKWANSFKATWPSLLSEPDSEKAKVEDIKFKAITEILNVILGAGIDPENKASLIQWAVDNFNDNEFMFETPLLLDYEALAAYEPPTQEPGNPEEAEGEKDPAPGGMLESPKDK